MTLIELGYLVALGQTLHFGRAARLCGVRQSTLSMALGKLEQDWSLTLFERGKNGVRPTPIGAQIITQAQVLLAETEQLKALAHDQLLAGELRLGAIFTLGPSVLPQLIPQLQVLAHNLRLKTYEAYQGELRDKLRSGHLDAILIADNFAEPEIATQEIYREPLQVAMPPWHPLAAKTCLQAQDLRAETCLILSEQECLRAHMLRAFTPEPGQSLECSSLDTLRHMLALGLGISILPIFALRSPLYSPQALTLRPLDSNPERSIFLAWRTSFPRHKVLDLVRRGLQLGSWQFTTAASPEHLSPLLSTRSWQVS